MIGKSLSSSPHSAGDIEAGFSGGAPSPTPGYRARGTDGALTPPPPARFFLDDLSDEGSQHFLAFCFLCKKHLGGNSDIYMYRGDTPFCSVECREQQIEMDETRERNRKLAMMEQHQKSSSLTKLQRIKVRFGTVVPV